MEKSVTLPSGEAEAAARVKTCLDHGMDNLAYVQIKTKKLRWCSGAERLPRVPKVLGSTRASAEEGNSFIAMILNSLQEEALQSLGSLNIGPGQWRCPGSVRWCSFVEGSARLQEACEERGSVSFVGCSRLHACASQLCLPCLLSAAMMSLTADITTDSNVL